MSLLILVLHMQLQLRSVYYMEITVFIDKQKRQKGTTIQSPSYEQVNGSCLCLCLFFLSNFFIFIHFSLINSELY